MSDHFTRWHNHAERLRRAYLDAINPHTSHAELMERIKVIHATIPKRAPPWVWSRACEAGRTCIALMCRYEMAYCVHELPSGKRICDPWGTSDDATDAEREEARQACRENRNRHFHYWKKTGKIFA